MKSGRRWAPRGWQRLALSGEKPEDVCVAPPIERVVQTGPRADPAISSRRRTFVRLYQDLKNTFVEYAA